MSIQLSDDLATLDSLPSLCLSPRVGIGGRESFLRHKGNFSFVPVSISRLESI